MKNSGRQDKDGVHPSVKGSGGYIFWKTFEK